VKILFTLVLCFVFAGSQGCHEANQTNDNTLLLPKNEIQYHLISAAQTPHGIRVRAFDHATPPKTSIQISFGENAESLNSDDHGRFDVTLSPVNEDPSQIDLQFQVNENTIVQTYRVRDLSEDASTMVQASVVTGQVPNDLHVTASELWVVSSADALLQKFHRSQTETIITEEYSLYFPIDAQNRGANPYEIAFHPTLPIVAVSLFSQHAIAVVDTEKMQLLYTYPFNQLSLIELEDSITIDTPLDVNGDQNLETEISQLYPRHPQALLWTEEGLWVAATNYLQFATNGSLPKAAPGTLLSFLWNNDVLNFNAQWQLNGYNPQDLKAEDDTLFILTTGMSHFDANGNWQAQSKAALWQKPLSSDTAIQSIFQFDQFAPAKMTLTDGAFVFGHTLSAEIGILDRALPNAELDIVSVENNTHIDSIFSVLNLGGGLLAIAQYNQDQIWFYDLRERTLNPWPFNSPISISSYLQQDIFKGLLKIATRPGQPGVDYIGHTLFGLTGLSSEIIPIQLSNLLGP
jgi:hypothetical protein